MSVYSATTEGEEALSAATTETLLCLIGATQVKAKIVEWGVSFDGTAPTAAAVVVRLIRTTSDDGTSSAATEIQFSDPDNPAPNCAVKHSYTVEPTKASQPIASYEVHPQSGIVIQYPLGREIGLLDSTSDGVAIDVTAPAVVNALAYIVWAE